MTDVADRDASTPTTWISPSHGWAAVDLPELWRYRELIYFLIWRDVKVRYKQTALGIGWALLQPLASALIFALFFGRLAGMPSDGVPYTLFSLAALVPWTLFANGLNQAANSVVGSGGLISKVYFPRLVIPIAAVGAGLVDFALAFLVLMGAIPLYGILPTIRIAWLPLFVVLALGVALGAGLWLSALCARYRDVHHTLPFLTQLWLFATPVAYPSSLVPEPWRALYGVNPMAGVVEGFRWALLGTGTGPGLLIAVSATVASILLLGGAMYFRRVERVIADVL
jgi:lipopolysaccharide transport system permease protein